MSRLHPNEIAFVAKDYWTGADLVTAVAVAWAESGGDPDALGISQKTVDGVTVFENVDCGLFQISNKWHATTADGKPGKLAIAGPLWRDPAHNARLAREVYDEFVRMGKVGWEAWQVYISGTYKKFLPLAELAVKAPWSPEQPDDAEAAVRKVLGQLDNRP